MIRNNQRKENPEAKRQNRRKWLGRLGMLSALLTVTAAVGGTLYWLNDTMRVTHWQVEGPEKLQAAIDIELTQQKGELDFIHAWPAHLRSELLADNPDLADIQIVRHLPDRLELRAIPRNSVALWQHGDKVWLVDDTGLAYRPIHTGQESPDLPLLRVDQQQLKESTDLLALLASFNPNLLDRLSELRASDETWRLIFNRGEMWLLPRHDTARQMARLTALLAKPRWQNRAWRVDARSAERWYLRPARHEGVI